MPQVFRRCPSCGTEQTAPSPVCGTCGHSFISADAATGIDVMSLGARPDAETAAAGASATGRTTGPLVVGQSFGPRYHIIRMLGAGGMGVVYQAWDAELNVAVA